MAVKNINQVCQKLIENGRAPDTPVAIIRWGTRADQTTLTGDLSSIPDIVRENEIKPPAVMVVGDVVRLRDTLKWYEERPLFGQRILVTREHSLGFEPLAELGAEIIEFHTVRIIPPESWDELDRAIENIQSYDWLILTSGNGVKYFFRRLFEKGTDIRELKGIKICAIGSKTASMINKFGIQVDLVPEKFKAEGLIKSFENLYDETGIKNVRFLLPRAEVAREVFPEKIRELGGEIDVPAAYRAAKPEMRGRRLKRFLKEGKITIATFTSAATFNNFMEMMGEDAEALLQDVAISVIGPVTAKAIEKAGLKVHIMPEEATIEAMVHEIINWATKMSNKST
jgi:uroporphyrinogen III methyltransferase/synthase